MISELARPRTHSAIAAMLWLVPAIATPAPGARSDETAAATRAGQLIIDPVPVQPQPHAPSARRDARRTALGDAFWQRCAYLESLLDYTNRCRNSYPGDHIRGAAESVHTQARCLATSAPDQQLRTRVDLLTQSGVAFQSALQ